jgi:hypothetical protein
VARVNLELFFKFQGSEYKNMDYGLILKKYRGLSTKIMIIRLLNYLLVEKLRGSGPQLVDHGRAGPRWTLDRGSAMTSPELGLTVAPGHGGSLMMAQQREREREREKHGESVSCLTGARAAVWRPGDGGE